MLFALRSLNHTYCQAILDLYILNFVLFSEKMEFKKPENCNPTDKGVFQKDHIEVILDAHNSFRQKVLKG